MLYPYIYIDIPPHIHRDTSDKDRATYKQGALDQTGGPEKEKSGCPRALHQSDGDQSFAPPLLFHTSPANIKFAHANPDRCSTTRLFCVSSFNFFYLSFFSLPRASAVPECHILPCQTITQYDGYRTRSKSLFHPYHLRQTR